MNAEEYLQLLNNPYGIKKVTAEQLESLAAEYHYSQNLQLLIAQKYYTEGDKRFDRQLRKTALYAPDREKLYNSFNQVTDEKFTPKEILDTDKGEEFSIELSPVSETKVIPSQVLNKLIVSEIKNYSEIRANEDVIEEIQPVEISISPEEITEPIKEETEEPSEEFITEIAHEIENYSEIKANEDVIEIHPFDEKSEEIAETANEETTSEAIIADITNEIEDYSIIKTNEDVKEEIQEVKEIQDEIIEPADAIHAPSAEILKPADELNDLIIREMENYSLIRANENISLEDENAEKFEIPERSRPEIITEEKIAALKETVATESQKRADKVEKHSFTEWLQQFKITKEQPIPNTPPKVIYKESSVSFPNDLQNVKSLEHITKVATTKTQEKQFSVKEMAEASVSDNEAFYTETLADLYVKQGKEERAIKIYEVLSLKYPEKLPYFADKIKQLKK